MKISIVTEGYKSTGYGHITRCLSLYQAFEERNLFPRLYINGDEECKSLIPNARFEIINWLDNFDLLSKSLQGSDIIIIDSYLAPVELYKGIASLTSLPVYVDDNLRLDYPAGTVINGSINAEAMPYQQRPGTSYLLGSKYMPLRKEFWTIKEKQIRSVNQTILITFGGQDLQNMTPRILRWFARNYPGLLKKVVVGAGFNNIEQIEALKDEQTEIYVNPNSAEMLKLMLDSDIAISAAGQTLYELARVGVPTLAISVADNQNHNLAGWMKEEFLTVEISYNNVNLENKLSAAFQKYSKKEIKQKASNAGKKKVDGQGAIRIIQSLVDQSVNINGGFYLRRPLEIDTKPVFNLTNDKMVRVNSMDQKAINWQDHIVWFTSKIIDPSFLFLLAFSGADEFIGMVRFDFEGNHANVSVSIVPEFRSKNYSTPMLINTSLKCFRERPDLEYICTYIRPINTTSVEYFTKAAYEFSHEETVNNESYLVYKMYNRK